ncbi:hypothetical protein LTR37_019238 [Vermiconidia calcicola]|uniref:Uncharacterized protein n=1 Tax=Vermiconidia calcicola TaxID=1690605 RepID=A0ACC3MHT0_9PEZI|nr:hypothetical protein LTR37_019238 [Vermiconidia calcicola]
MITLQTVLAAIILALSISLALGWGHLEQACGDPPYSKECSRVLHGAGAMRYCIFVGIWGFLDVAVYLVDNFLVPLPPWVAVAMANVSGGVAMGGGSTLAALINGWKCEAGKDGALHLCHQIYANIAFLFMLVAVSWATAFALWPLRRYHSRPDSRLS